MTNSAFQRTPDGLTVDLDQLPANLRREFEAELVKVNQVPLFQGTVEHFYSKVVVSKTRICPRCKAPTERKCAHFIYATDTASRVMLAPAGYFCTRCPTVIVDERIISQGVTTGIRFRAVLGIHLQEKGETCLFRTVNGRKPVYILDEDEQMVGISSA